MAYDLDPPPLGSDTSAITYWLRVLFEHLRTFLSSSGVAHPQLTTVKRDAIKNPPDGLMIYNTTTSELEIRKSGAWKQVTTS